jgi:predicted lactoylglutathione lyase
MIKECRINLPVKDIGNSKAFFSELGFPMNTQYGDNDHSASLLTSQHKIALMLFDEPSFKGSTGKAVADAEKATEVLFSTGVESTRRLFPVYLGSLFWAGRYLQNTLLRKLSAGKKI